MQWNNRDAETVLKYVTFPAILMFWLLLQSSSSKKH
jgi:hypothetical protein